MARVTVEDCIEYVPSRFELVILAAKRARQLSRGAEPTLPTERDKFTVLALREIGEGAVDPEQLRLEEEEVPEEELLEGADQEAQALMAEETAMAGVVQAESLEGQEGVDEAPANDVEGED